MVLLSLFFLNLVVLQAFATDADLESVSGKTNLFIETSLVESYHLTLTL